MSLFANRDYRHLLSAQVISLFGAGLTTVALGLFAYELAGPSAGVVLGTALTIKMAIYVLVAPIAAAFADKLPRRMLLVVLDVVRAAVVLVLPFASEIWHIYVLVALLQAASAIFTPTFQAVIPSIVTNKDDYTRALSASQVAYTMESLLSPVLAAIALSFLTFNWLFLGTSVGFIISAVFVLSTRIPDAQPSGHSNAWQRISGGIKQFAKTPRLRGIMALNLVVAAAGSIVIVNTVNHVRDELGGSQTDVAWMLAASGGGTLAVALTLPRVLKKVSDRAVMLSGAAVLVIGAGSAVVSTMTGFVTMTTTAALWFVIGAGMALIVTPTGRVLRSSARPENIPAIFAAQFSLSHLAWLITYPIAGWLGTAAGFTVTWSILAFLAIVGTIAAALLWQRNDTSEIAQANTAPPGVSSSRTPAMQPIVASGNTPEHLDAGQRTMTHAC